MKTRNTILVLGGCRSGKSRHALELGAGYLGNLSLIHISEPTRQVLVSRMPSSA